MKKILICLFMSLLLSACNSGSTALNNNNSTINVNTFNYNPGNKTAVNVSIGGGPSTIAEIDTGSDMTVVNESAVGSDIIKTTESITMTYGGGQNVVKGYLAYGSVTFTTSNGGSLSTSSLTPLLVVTEGSVNEGGGNNAILGMRMNNQVSVRLFLPYPYDQMMVLNRSESQIIFGNLSFTQLSEFATVAMESVSCVNYLVPLTAHNDCFNLESNAVNYSYSILGGESDVSYPTILDSGEAIATFYLESQPEWMILNGNVIENTMSAAINTSKGILPLPLTNILHYSTNPGNSANPGNNLFNTYQVLFDQVDGLTGFKDYNSPL